MVTEVSGEVFQNLVYGHPSREGMTEDAATGVSRGKPFEKRPGFGPCVLPTEDDLRPSCLRVRVNRLCPGGYEEELLGAQCAVKLLDARPEFAAEDARVLETGLNIRNCASLRTNDVV